MRNYMEKRAIELAEYIIENGATVRDAAKQFGVSKSTVHKDVGIRLENINRCLYVKVKAVLELNKSERHIRGGRATKEKYQKKPDFSKYSLALSDPVVYNVNVRKSKGGTESENRCTCKSRLQC